jgi:hypothetical protein
MRGYLRTKKMEGGEVGSASLDVTIDYPAGADILVDSLVEVRITEPNGLYAGMAYVSVQYPWFEAEGNAEVLGAEIVGPETGIPGLLPIGTILIIRFIRT